VKRRSAARGRYATWLAVLSVSVWALIVGVLAVHRATLADSWQLVEGHITVSRVTVGCGRGGREAFPEIQYAYAYGGQSYTGSRIALDSDYCGWGASEIVKRFRPGQRVPVYVNPGSLAEAVLVGSDTRSPTIWLIVAGALGAAVAVVALLHRLSGGA
jgi:hypothetical protein